jgi:hypothetical protein
LSIPETGILPRAPQPEFPALGECQNSSRRVQPPVFRTGSGFAKLGDPFANLGIKPIYRWPQNRPESRSGDIQTKKYPLLPAQQLIKQKQTLLTDFEP